MTKIINKALIEKSINYAELRDQVEQYYLKLKDEKISVSPRTFITTKDAGFYIIGAATNFENENYITMSQPVMPWFGENALPVATTSYMYTNYRTGELLAVVGGADLVQYRTPAKSALAAKFLMANKSEYTIGLIGLGVQAISHAEAFCSLFNVSRILGSARTPSKWQANIDQIKDKTGKEVEILAVEETIKQSDILIVITSSKDPIVHFDQLHKGQLVIGTDHAETVAKDVVINADKVFVDYRPTAENENATIKLMLANGQKYEDLVDGELTDLITGKVKGRESDNEIIFFQSLGVLCENLAAVEYLYQKVGGEAQEVEI